MVDALNDGDRSSRNPILIGVLLLTSGLALNYLFERNSVFKIWENSAYPVSALDGLYPPLCVFLSLTGVVLTIGGAIRHATPPFDNYGRTFLQLRFR